MTMNDMNANTMNRMNHNDSDNHSGHDHEETETIRIVEEHIETERMPPVQTVPVYQVPPQPHQPHMIRPTGASAGTIVLAVFMLVVGAVGIWVAVQYPFGWMWSVNVDHLGVWILGGLGVVLIAGAIAVAATGGRKSSKNEQESMAGMYPQRHNESSGTDSL
ncbi:hypothetical protein BMAGN_0740 [Bifidobacterium magnum]|uniref:Uncharacterized protein n=2 Tax=Bifidobacterium magnum TaxID=1692 RepID=A0A087BCW3_9BIFI|nr:hypothetical protein BMAGN_0740 [Bifidobacterium magnum]